MKKGGAVHHPFFIYPRAWSIFQSDEIAGASFSRGEKVAEGRVRGQFIRQEPATLFRLPPPRRALSPGG